MQQEPFSRMMRVDALPKEGQTVSIEANSAEREALAAFLNLPSIEALSASLALMRSTNGGVRVIGAVHGELTQVCVVSLEPFPATVDEEIDVRFAPRADGGGARGPAAEAETFSMMDESEPDPIVDGKIDLGALAAEFLALGLDPYPRKPGASFESPEEPEAMVSPFSALASRAQKKPG
jgi:Large ribosomal RNA subunit accumulation protein YceD